MTVYVVMIEKIYYYADEHVITNSYADSVFTSVEKAFDRIDVLFERFIHRLIENNDTIRGKHYETLRCMKTSCRFEYEYIDYFMVASKTILRYSILTKELDEV